MIFLILLLTFLMPGFLQAAEAQEPIIPPSVGWQNLPKELKLYIFDFVVSANSLEEISKEISRLRKVDNAFKKLTNDEAFTASLINELAQGLAQRYVESVRKEGPPGYQHTSSIQDLAWIAAAATLHTPASLTQLKNYLEQNPSHMIAAKYLLVQASCTNQIYIMDSLLKVGLSPNSRTYQYGVAAQTMPPLFCAAMKNFLLGVRLLLNAGADVDQRGPLERTVLEESIIGMRNPGIIKELLQAGAQVNRGLLRDAYNGFLFPIRPPNAQLIENVKLIFYALPNIDEPLTRLVMITFILDFKESQEHRLSKDALDALSQLIEELTAENAQES